MGKYTSPARKIEETSPQEKVVDKGGNNAYKHSISVGTARDPVPSSSEDSTNLRTTNLTNLIDPAPSKVRADNGAVPCIHETTADRCAVCSGFVRWLIADEARMHRAEADPGAVRREFWRAVRGEV